MSDDKFIIDVLSNMECKVYEKNDLIVQSGSKLQYLYFIRKGSVYIKDEKNNDRLAILKKQSWFGDY